MASVKQQPVKSTVINRPAAAVIAQRQTVYWVLGLFIVALAIRVAFFYPERFTQPSSDAWEFDQLAWSLAQGEGYTLSDEPTARRSPGFPMLLAALYFFLGWNWFAARMLMAILSALTVSVVYLTGVRLFDHKVGVMASMMVAVYPLSVSLVAILFSESLFNLLIALSIFWLIKVGQGTARTVDKLMAGVFLGVATLTRPEPILLLPFLALWIFWLANFNLLNGAKLSWLIFLPAVIMVFIWTARNYYALNAFIPTTTGGGSVIRGAYNDLTFTDQRYMGGWVASFDLPGWDELKQLPEVERDRLRYQMGITSIKENLKRLPKLEMYKFHNFVFGGTKGMVVLRFPIIFFAVIGLAISWMVDRRKYSIIYVFLIYYLMHALVFYASDRFRMAVEPYLFMFAIFGVFQSWKVLRHYKALPLGKVTL